MELNIRLEQLIEDIGGQFMMESGSDKPLPPKGVLIQFLNEAYAGLAIPLARYSSIKEESRLTSDGNLSNGCYGFELVLTNRRIKGKTMALTDTLHSYMVNAGLSKVYAIANLVDLSNKRSSLANSDMQKILQLLNTKCPPEL